ncbi:MAG TPA: SPOR domain-containing protein [Alphaproteobacteria bacterium]|nr:SPOR domain-containing protein [Alphaproteobacteria bacterium]
MAEPGDRAVPDRKTESGASGASGGLDFEPVTRKKGSQSLNIKLFFTLVVITVIGGGGAWYFYGQRLAGGDDAVPLIRAAEGPVKVRPDNPGGMIVPDRDKLVYDRMQGMEGRPAERLLPPPEIPLAPPGAETLEKTVTAPAVMPSPVTSPPALEPAARPTTKEVLAAKPPSPPPPVLEDEVKKLTAAAKPKAKKEAATPAAKPETLMARAAKPPKAQASVYRVQLAAVRTQKRAREEWGRLQKKHSTLLGLLTMSLTRADLGTKGVFYRLRAGPLATESAARELCDELAKRKVGCLIIRPVIRPEK